MVPLSKVLLFSAVASASSTSLRGSNNNKHRSMVVGSTTNDDDERHLLFEHTRIINGNKAVEDRYSYAVSLQDDVGHFCGGSLIAPDVVLSAAHCAAGEYKAVIGRHSLQDTDGEEMTIKVEMMHPEYSIDTTDNDFMLLFLEKSVTVNADMITVSPDIIPAGVDATVMG
jgi:hypothetical protein